MEVCSWTWTYWWSPQGWSKATFRWHFCGWHPPRDTHATQPPSHLQTRTAITIFFSYSHPSQPKSSVFRSWTIFPELSQTLEQGSPFLSRWPRHSGRHLAWRDDFLNPWLWTANYPPEMDCLQTLLRPRHRSLIRPAPQYPWHVNLMYHAMDARWASNNYRAFNTAI